MPLHGGHKVTRARLGWLASLVALCCPTAAHAEFLGINGLNRAELQRNKVTVALVSVVDLTVTWRTSYARSGHLELKLVQSLFGAKPTPPSLKRVPYTSGVGYNSAWPDLGAKPTGSHLVMAWRNGHACGEGSAVHLGERFSLPMAVSGPADPRVAAVRDVLKLVSISEEAGRLKTLHATFEDSENPYLVIMSDAALTGLDPHHRSSALRYSRLLGTINGAPRADEELGWPLLRELTRFPAPRDADAYETWKKDSRGPSEDGSWPSFPQLRRMIQARLRGYATNLKASTDLRRWAVTALSAPPSFVGLRKDRLDAAAIATVTERLRDPVNEVRRDAARGLLSMGAALQSIDAAASHRLVGEVKKMLRKETDPEERANLQLRIDEVAGRSD